MNKKILVSLVLFFISLNALAGQVIPREYQIILTDNSQSWGPKIEWIPTEPQTSLALKRIEQYLKTNNTFPSDFEEQKKTILKSLSKYSVQFVGIVVDGRKLIHCNFFPRSANLKDVRNTYVFVFDGGTSFWRIDYDIERDSCLNFEVNGEG
ncbi:hypothetical protein M0R36_04710 [bacterium]|nr:hypothetical protein [bacterium]